MYIKYPLSNVGITSKFGMRQHPITGVSTFHYGLDMGWSKYSGEPVLATYDAVVVAEGYNSSMGNYVVIKYDKNNKTMFDKYMHLKNRALVKKGKVVVQGQKLGYMGATGLATGVHLHIEHWVCPKGYKYNGSDAAKYAKDPLDYYYLFDDQTASKGSISLLKKVVGTPINRNVKKDQIKVIKTSLNCRTGAGLSNKRSGFINLGYYNILSTKKVGNTTWYRIDYNKWIAGLSNYTKLYLKQTEIDTKDEASSYTIDLNDYKSYTSTKAGNYYIYLDKNETIYFPK